MPQISRFPIKKNIEKQIINNLEYIITKLRSDDEVYKFLDDFLTKTEKIMLAKRLAIVLMLQKGYHIVDIRDILNVSTSTIFRISQQLERGSKGYKIALAKFGRKEKLDAFWKEVEDFIKYVGRGKRVFS